MSSLFQCRSCQCDQGQVILDLGHQPLANRLLIPENLNRPEPRFPLRLFVCPACWLLQVADTVTPGELFSDYLYFSSFSDAMLQHARRAADHYIADFELDRDSFVMEIASNDGYLLQHFVQADIPCVGIEPAANVARVAEQKGVKSIVDFFGAELAGRLAREGRQADLILGNNVFAHVPAINDFVAGLRTLLKPAGRIVLEFPYAVDMLEKTEFDTVYHEHVFYFTLTALVPLFERHGLAVVDVERLSIHGGSLRIYVQHVPKQDSPSPALRAAAAHHPGGAFREGSPPIGSGEGGAGRTRVAALLKEEQDKSIDSQARYEGFAGHVAGIRQDLRRLILDLTAQGKTVAAYGASAKGSTLLNYCGLDHRQIHFVADRSTYKQGRLTPGTHIPIVPPGELLKRMPDHTLLLTWNFADEILEQQKDYREAGGRFIIPIPEVRMV